MSAQPASTARETMHHHIEQHHATLHRILRHYVLKFGLCGPHPPHVLAQTTQQLLQETVLTALEHANRFDPTREVLPWLMGIGLNHIRAQLRQRGHQRELPVADLLPANSDLSSDAFFEHLQHDLSNSLENDVVGQTWLDHVLAMLAADERLIVELAVLHELDSTTIAHQLNISAGAARVRLHRALKRLRHLLALQGENDQ